MVFSDLFFLFVFIPAFALMYLLAGWIDKKLLFRPSSAPSSDTPPERPKFMARNLSLVVFSLIFYAWGEPVYIFLMIVCVIINYLAGLGIAHCHKRRMRRLWLVSGLVLDLSLLGVFKYLGFFSGILSSLGLELNAPKLALPIGISFYTFQSISYLVDVYRREAQVQRRFLDLLLYISMFPQLIAGPIVRYGTVAREIHDRHVSAQDMAEGAYRFFIGLGKKVIISNMLSEIATQFLADGIGNLSMAGAWIGISAFTLQIYFDFSGYSDMAIGMGRCMGFHFNENFNHPYCCTSITDFWRRWHISLGSFFRDYAYIPMGGNRHRQALNLLTVWFLTGMWHGATWNFIIWGLYFGIIVAIEKYTVVRWQKRLKGKPGGIALGWLLRLYALFLVVIGWGIFYFDNFDNMQQFFLSLSGQRSLEVGLVELSALWDNFWLWIVAIVLCVPLRRWVERAADASVGRIPMVGHHAMAAARAIVSIILLFLSVALLVGATNNAFIYTRF